MWNFIDFPKMDFFWNYSKTWKFYWFFKFEDFNKFSLGWILLKDLYLNMRKLVLNHHVSRIGIFNVYYIVLVKTIYDERWHSWHAIFSCSYMMKEWWWDPVMTILERWRSWWLIFLPYPVMPLHTKDHLVALEYCVEHWFSTMTDFGYFSSDLIYSSFDYLVIHLIK